MRGLKLHVELKDKGDIVSHLLQMRGLKLTIDVGEPNLEVASFTDAWIETKTEYMRQKQHLSHLLQMRGLKHISEQNIKLLYMSHLLQMRGLKLM